MHRLGQTLSLLAVTLVLSLSAPAFAQKQFNIWYFGNNEKMDFNTSPPTHSDDGAIVTGEGSAVISDPVTGEVIFYTEGRTLFNRKDEPMPNGDGLLSHPSSTQAALITRDPSNPNRYYVFATAMYPGFGVHDGISYSIVDMTRDNGFGDVVQKNIVLHDGMAEKLMAIGTLDESSYWIIGQEMNSKNYHAWKLTKDGLDHNSVVSQVGRGVGTDHSATIGWLAASPTGTMFGASYWDNSSQHCELYKFDFATGTFSDAVILPAIGGAYGAAFSADGSKFYCGGDAFVHQFDVSVYDASTIRSSRKSIEHRGPYTVSVKLGPDGNVYVRTPQYLGRITNANSASFQFDPMAIPLGASGDVAIGLCNDPVLITAGVKPRKLSASLTSLDFGPINLCEERDSIVTITNTGEAAVTITNATIDKNFRIVGLTLPVTLDSGKSLDIQIETIADPSNQLAVLTGTLSITSDADEPLPPVTLVRGMLYPVRVLLQAREDATGKSGDNVTFDIMIVGDVPAGITAIRFDLLHNNDLLTYTGMNANGLVLDSTKGLVDQRQSFTLTNLSEGVIGTLTFKAFLAASSSTDLRFENVVLKENGLSFAPECIVAMSDSNATFTYTNTCGDGVLQEYLATDDIIVSSVSPNPARDIITLDLDARMPDTERGSEVSLAILSDAMGREMDRWGVANGRNQFDISHVPAGTYYLVIRSAFHAKTHRVVVRR